MPAPGDVVTVVDAVGAVISGEASLPYLQALKRGLDDQEVLLEVHLWNEYPELRPEDFETYEDENPYLVLLRLLLWTEQRLRRPSQVRVQRTPLCGPLAARWWALLRPWRCGARGTSGRLVRAYDIGGRAYAELDKLFDPWTGALPPLAPRLNCAVSDEAPAASYKRAREHQSRMIAFLNVGHDLDRFQGARDIPQRTDFRAKMAETVERLKEAFELLRIEIVEEEQGIAEHAEGGASTNAQESEMIDIARELGTPSRSPIPQARARCIDDATIRDWVLALPATEHCRRDACQLLGLGTDDSLGSPPPLITQTASTPPRAPSPTPLGNQLGSDTAAAVEDAREVGERLYERFERELRRARRPAQADDNAAAAGPPAKQQAADTSLVIDPRLFTGVLDVNDESESGM